jgi:hypothetical protein
MGSPSSLALFPGKTDPTPIKPTGELWGSSFYGGDTLHDTQTISKMKNYVNGFDKIRLLNGPFW